MADKKKATTKVTNSKKKTATTSVEKVEKKKVVKKNTASNVKNTGVTKDKTVNTIPKKNAGKTSSKTVKVKPKTTKNSKKNLDDTKSLPKLSLDEKKKAKAKEKSRQANLKSHEVSAKRKKREATRIIPVDKILEAQRQAELLAQKRINEENENRLNKKKRKSIIPQKNNKVKENSISKAKKRSKIKFNFNLKDFKHFSRIKKLYVCIIAFCILLLLVEGVYYLVIRNYIESKHVYYDSLNSLTLDGTDVVAVGSSNFKNSNYNKYTDGLEKAKLVKYDKNYNILFEKMYDKGINSTFNSIIQTEDGYVVVGSYEKDKEQTNNQLRTGLIVKYDKKGKVQWDSTFTSLSNTQFTKVAAVDDGYIVIGQSIYANMEMGNSENGGGVIIKYSKDGQIQWKKFHGGTKSASFNGIAIVGSDIYVVGRDGTDFGNIVKYNSSGEYQWHKNYRYTDTLGLSDVVYSNGKLYAVGAKEIFDHEVTDDDKRSTTNTDALLICYDLDGNIVFERTFGGSSYDRYNSIMAYHNDLFAIGSSSSDDSGLRIFTDGKKTTGILVKYDTNGNIERKYAYGGSNQDNLTDIVTDNSNLYITAYTNSKDGNIITSKDNGKDYFGRLIKVDSRLRLIYTK